MEKKLIFDYCNIRKPDFMIIFLYEDFKLDFFLVYIEGSLKYLKKRREVLSYLQMFDISKGLDLGD